MSLENYADKYFAKLNSIAARMYQDMEETKSNYEDLWYKITDNERKQILSDSIIKPEITIKYQIQNNNDSNNVDDKKYAAKLIIDDNCLYQDEHSGPFSYKTQSQRDLRIYDCKQIDNNRMNQSIVSTKNVKITDNDKADNKIEELTFAVDDKSTTVLPKTGLDFLDNW